jgi:hypothetical protein
MSDFYKETFIAEARNIALIKDYNENKVIIDRVEFYEYETFINCLKLGISIKDSSELTTKIFKEAGSSRFSMDEIFHQYQREYILKNTPSKEQLINVLSKI